MALFNLTELCATLPHGQRLLGLDPGARMIGIALSDAGLRLAGPYGQLRRGKLTHNAAEIRDIARREGAGGLVVGLPLGLDDSFGPAAQAARDWARALSEATGLPAAMVDERHSSVEVHEVLNERTDLRRSARAAMVDRMAAAVILQRALDVIATARNVPGPGGAT